MKNNMRVDGTAYLRKKGPQWAWKLAATAVDFFFPWGTYCVCCGNFIDNRRSYLLCDHCIHHITWGNVEIPPESLKHNHFTGPEAEFLQREDGIPLDSIRACMKYGLYERRLIFELKYNRHTFMARILGKILADRILNDPGAAELVGADFIIPVPMHKAKERQRGFNQAVKTARYLGCFLGIPVLEDGLMRRESTAAQRSVEGKDRLANLSGAFAAGTVHSRIGRIDRIGRIGRRGRIDRGKRKYGIRSAKKISLAEVVRGKRVILLDDIFTTGATVLHCGRALKEAGAAEVHVLVLATGNDYAVGFFENPLANEEEIM